MLEILGMILVTFIGLALTVTLLIMVMFGGLDISSMIDRRYNKTKTVAIGYLLIVLSVFIQWIAYEAVYSKVEIRIEQND